MFPDFPASCCVTPAIISSEKVCVKLSPPFESPLFPCRVNVKRQPPLRRCGNKIERPFPPPSKPSYTRPRCICIYRCAKMKKTFYSFIFPTFIGVAPQSCLLPRLRFDDNLGEKVGFRGPYASRSHISLLHQADGGKEEEGKEREKGGALSISSDKKEHP